MCKNLIASFTLLVCSSLAWSGPLQAETRSRAVLVGINEYESSSVGRLNGTDADLIAMHTLLTQRFGFKPDDIVVLKDAAAKRDAILRAIAEHLAQPSDDDDIAVFYFSGHGSQVTDTNGDELDGYDETLVASDSRLNGAPDITDDELNQAFAAVTMTYHFVEAAKADRWGTYRSIMPRVQSAVNAAYPSQMPQMEGEGLDSPVFGIGGSESQHWIVVNPDERGRARVSAGSLYGLTKGVELQIHPPGSAPISGESSVRLVIDSAEPDSATGQLIGAAEIAPFSRARVDKVSFDLRPRKVWFDMAIPVDKRDLMETRLRDYQSLVQIPNENEADLRVTLNNDVYTVVGRDGVAMSGIAATDPNVPKEVVGQLHGWARWLSLQSLQNPEAPELVSVSVRVAGSPPNSPVPTSVPNGTRLTMQVRNLSAEPLYLAVLDMSTSGSIKSRFVQGAQEALAPNATHTFPANLVTNVPEGLSQVTETFKVIASTTPLDASGFQQGAMRKRAANAYRTPLDAMLADRINVGFRETSESPIALWSTAQQSFRINRSGSLLASSVGRSIALHFDVPANPTELATRLSTGERSLCTADAAGRCTKAKLLSQDGHVIEIESQALQAKRNVGGRRIDSVGQAFDDAYLAGEKAGAIYAEPLFEVSSELPENTGTRGGDAPPDEIAAGDELWSLKYVNVPAAWDIVRQKTNHAPGEEAKGIYVGHPDTGYTLNPENFLGATLTPVAVDFGFDYVENNKDAKDFLLDARPLDNPAHGTGSGSVIVSMPGCQIANKQQCVTGVAPGARLMPFRVNRSVVVFNQAGLSRAINDAANGTHGQRADVISIAMGGPPTRTLHRAVRDATAKGTIVVAAAGNYVRTVVWPARFSEVVAVSAINPKCAPWPHASRGRAVDFSAPGENVWRATTNKQVGNRETFDNGMGAGTTFATGTTAGIAALWLAANRAEPGFEELQRQGAVADAFRLLARNTAWVPGDSARPPPTGVTCKSNEWKASKYGAGVIDARALLAAPLPAPDALANRVRDVDDTSTLPLFETLYDGSGANRAAQDYRAIFREANAGYVERFETEVMFQYTSSEEVADAIDALVQGGQTSAAAAARVRTALLSQDLSERLRGALTALGAGVSQ